MSDADHLWIAAAQLLRAQVSEAVWLSTFQDARAERVDGERLVLVVPSSHVRERIEGRYLPIVRDAFVEIGQPALELEIEVRPGRTDDDTVIDFSP
ncbi:MAG TPA: DnaA N-terminal domain-containing protein, partial [Acidimicrobiales bacterium]|nr:DnaA N-terminal domain-containing protein [Acidimicrobiales bacterium]